MSVHGVVMAAGQGPVIQHTAPGRSFTLKLQNDETAESVMMFEEVAPVGTATGFHTHHESDEVAYVLSGEITFKIGDEITVGGPGSCAFMPRDVPHAWKSTGGEAARVLFLYTPRTYHRDTGHSPAHPPARDCCVMQHVGPLTYSRAPFSMSGPATTRRRPRSQ